MKRPLVSHVSRTTRLLKAVCCVLSLILIPAVHGQIAPIPELEVGDPAFNSPNGHQVTGQYSAAFGSGNSVGGTGSVAIGAGNTIGGDGAGVFGHDNSVSTNFSLVIGEFILAEGGHLLAVGNNHSIQAPYSLVTGENNDVIGAMNVVFGSGNAASSSRSLVSGAMNAVDASAENSLTVGVGLRNFYMNSGVIGEYNSVLPATPRPLFVIGNGNSDNQKSNAFVVYKDGHADLAGYLNLTGPNARLMLNGAVMNPGVASELNIGVSSTLSSGSFSGSIGMSNSVTGRQSLVVGEDNNVLSQSADTITIGAENRLGWGFALGVFGYENRIWSEAAGDGTPYTTSSPSSNSIIAGGWNSVGQVSGSLVIGENNTVHSSQNVAVIGKGLLLTGIESTIVGRFNREITATAPTPTPLFVVANGTGPAPANRSNALEVYSDAKVVAPGSVEVGGQFKASSGLRVLPDGTVLVKPSSGLPMGQFAIGPQP